MRGDVLLVELASWIARKVGNKCYDCQLDAPGCYEHDMRCPKRKIPNCPICNNKMGIERVGDWKQFYAVWCPQCNKYFVPRSCGTYTIPAAIKEFYKHTKGCDKN